MVGIDLLKFVDNLIKACFLGKGQSEATCSALSFNLEVSSYQKA